MTRGHLLGIKSLNLFGFVQVLYGATDMLTGQEFLKQLEDLANRSGFRSSSSSSVPGPS
jgi:hypothetical protein